MKNVGERWGGGVFALVAAAALCGGAAGEARAGSRVDRAAELQIYDRDVHVVRGATLRHPDELESVAPDEPLFNESGVPLEVTWGEFSQAAATAAETRCRGKRSDVSLSLTGLVPNGVYSIFWVTLDPDSENPACPRVERALPLVSTDKRQSPDYASFVADADGNADFDGRAPGCLLDAGVVVYEVIWHFDGHTYGDVPNYLENLTRGRDEPCNSSYGYDAFRQLLILQKYYD